MKRLARLAAAVGIVALMVLAPTPALAVQPVPPPVTPLPGLPSTTLKGITNAGTVGNQTANFYAWILGQAKYAQGGGKAIAPVAAPQALTKVSGGPLVGAFMLGWGITDGTLAMYGAATGQNPLEGKCDQAEWLQVVIDLTYMMSAPDCRLPVLDPNTGITPGNFLTYGSLTLRYLGPGNNDSACMFRGTSVVPSDKVIIVRNASDTQWVNVGLPGNGGLSSRCSATADGWYSTATIRPLTLALTDKTAWINNLNGYQQNPQLSASMQQTDADPQRQLGCTITWEDGVTTTGGFDAASYYTEATGIPYDTVRTGCTEAYVSRPGAGPDLLPSEIKVGSRLDGAQTEIATQEVPEYTEAERKGLDPGDGTGLKLWKITAAGKSSCMTWAADCRGWWTKTGSATNPNIGNGEKYRCEFGGSVVDLIECGVYRNTFEEQTDTPRITDPEDGTEKDWTTEVEGDGNSTNPGTGPSPGDRCLSQWADIANPIEWVLQPVKCALVWAFAPRPEKVDEFGQKLDNNWKSSVPGQLAQSLAGLSIAFGALGDGSCSGIPIQMPDGFHSDGSPKTSSYQFMYACDGILAPVASGMFWVCTAGILFMGAIGTKISLDKMVGNT